MYSFPELEPVYCSMSVSNCCLLTCIQTSQEAGNGLIFPSLEEFSTVCCESHSQAFGIINKVEVDLFFWYSLAFSMIQRLLAICSLVLLPFLNTA